jgi:hypothetical protein
MHDVPGVPCRNYRVKSPEPPDDVRRIALGRGQYAYVDAADYEWLSQWHWRLHAGYAVRHEKGNKRIFMHRQIMRAPKGMVVDHFDGNPRNNYRSNLRICTPVENARNRARQDCAGSRFKGISLDRKTGKWVARVHFEGRYAYLGCFGDEVEAARAYDRAAAERFGVFARPNFPEDWPVERREEVHAQWLKANGRQKRVSPRARRARKPDVKRHKATSVRATRKARPARQTRGKAGRRSLRTRSKPARV